MSKTPKKENICVSSFSYDGSIRRKEKDDGEKTV